MKSKKKDAISIDLLNEGGSLQSVIDKFASLGVKDLSKVCLRYNSVPCRCDHGDNYCYCDSSYEDIRYVYEE